MIFYPLEPKTNCNILKIFISTCKSFHVNLVKFLEYLFYRTLVNSQNFLSNFLLQRTYIWTRIHDTSLYSCYIVLCSNNKDWLLVYMKKFMHICKRNSWWKTSLLRVLSYAFAKFFREVFLTNTTYRLRLKLHKKKDSAEHGRIIEIYNTIK